MTEKLRHDAPDLEAQKRAFGMASFIEKTFLKGGDSEGSVLLEGEIRKDYDSRTLREKADILYEKIMAYVMDKSTHTADAPFSLNEDLATEIKVLFEDKAVKDLFLKTYADARIDAKSYRLSDLGKTWKHLNEQIETVEKEFQQMEQALFLKMIEGKSNISSAKSKTERLAKRLLALKEQREHLKTLDLKDVYLTPENTDVAATFQFETIVGYSDQLKKGFVWLPSREKIHIDTVAALQNGRWPVLVGEAGTGKSDQADAASLELTGSLPTEVECSEMTAEKDLITDIKPDKNDGNKLREEYQPLMQAFTGFDGPWQKIPSHKKGRIARFDESGRLGIRAYAIIKKTRQKTVGDDFYGHPVLPGASAIWTTNPVGVRYPDRHPVDPAMRREIAEIYVDYPDQSSKNPEQFEFMLCALLDENRHIPGIAEKELAPAYIRNELTEAEKYKLPDPDGRIVVAKDLLIEDAADKNHGTLWRLANAIKVLQNSFVYGNHPPENPPPDALRFKEDDKGVITLDTVAGELLTLSSSTITLGEVKSWMQGFKDRLQKQNEAFQVESFSGWIKLKIDTYLKQVDQADRAKVKAIFEHFHLLDAPPDLKGAEPITPKQIGYLSPRVPRPLYVEAPPKTVDNPDEPEILTEKPPELYTAVEIILDSGKTVRIRKGEHSLRTKVSPELLVGAKTRFMVEGSEYSFAGTLEDNKEPVGSLLAEPDLYTIFTPEQVERGITDYSFQKLEKDVKELCEMTQM